MDSLIPSSFSIFITIAAFFLSFITIKTLASKTHLKNKAKKYHPIAGTVFHQLLHFKRIHHYRTELSAKYKTCRLLGPSRSEIYTADPANVEHILKTKFENYGKGSENYKNLSALLGDGIFVVDGEKWRHQRKVSSYEFSAKNLRDFSSRIFLENAVKLANVVANASSANQVVDIQDLFLRSTLDSIFKVAFGVDLDCITGTNEEGMKFSAAFDEANALITWRYVDLFWPIKRFLNVGSEARLKKSVKDVDKFVYQIINEARKKPTSTDDSSVKNDHILSRFLRLSDTDSKYLRDIILNFVIAGKDTTGGTLAWFIYTLCKHPEIQHKIAEDIRNATKLEGNTNIAELAAHLSEASLEKMHYLHATLSETLRLYPAIPADPKECFSDDTLPDGYSVKKGDIVFYLPYAMGRMKFVWGDDAEVFHPERWLNEDGVFQPENPFKFTAFQAGPRICLGKEFAYRQMKIFAAILVSSFIFKLANEEEPVNYITMLNLHVDGGLHVRVMHR
ncbi:Cytochrome P450 704C1-like protein [Drosera capensis]